MVTCPKCNAKVNNALLRSESPKCENGHDLGLWVSCVNQNERHVYLSLNGVNCPYCNSQPGPGMKEGARVRCLHATNEGAVCTTRAFVWMREGPPCFMNHIEKMALE
jgi:hypothetical protein